MVPALLNNILHYNRLGNNANLYYMQNKRDLLWDKNIFIQ